MPERDTDRPDLRPAVFFDRDNTLIPAADYLGDPREVKLMEGAAEAVAGVRQMGFAVVAISNQSGVARGYYTENDVRSVNARLDELLAEEDEQAVIDRHDFCPHHPTHGVAPYRQACQCRKPKDGMLRRSASALGLDLHRSWLIGDAPRDIEAGHAAGCRTILLRVEGIPSSPAARENPRVQPDYTVSSLREALQVIQRDAGFETAEEDDTLREADTAPQPDEERMDLVAEPESPERLAEVDAPVEARGEEAGFEDYEDERVPGQTVAQERVLERLISPTESEPEVETLRSGSSRRGQEAAPGPTADRIAATTAQILDDLRRQRETPREDFNMFRLLAGVVQVLALAAVVWGLMRDFDVARLVLAVFLQLLTITLLVASRQAP